MPGALGSPCPAPPWPLSLKVSPSNSPFLIFMPYLLGLYFGTFPGAFFCGEDISVSGGGKGGGRLKDQVERIGEQDGFLSVGLAISILGALEGVDSDHLSPCPFLIPPVCHQL